MWCGRFRITLSLLNVVCPPFRTTTLVDNETIEGQIGEGCLGTKLQVARSDTAIVHLRWVRWESHHGTQNYTRTMTGDAFLSVLGVLRGSNSVHDLISDI